MKRTAVIVVIALIALAAALGSTMWLAARDTTVYTDADRIRVPAHLSPLRNILWQPAAPLLSPLRTDADEYEPSLSADGTKLYFVRGRAGQNAELFECTLTPEGWSDPESLAGINTDADELGPSPSADGRSLYFYSDRVGGHGGYDLWIAQRADNGWGAPANLGPGINSAFNDYGPAPTPDGLHLYFASNRPRPDDPERDLEAWPATVREQRHRGDYDLYVTELGTSDLAPPVPVVALNTPSNEGCPTVSPVGDFLYFASDRPGGSGGFDLYRSRRLRGGHTAPGNLGDAINSHANDLDPALSTGGFAIHFSSNRPPLTPAREEGASGGERSRTYDIYHSISREVFREQGPVLAGIDWTWLLRPLWWLLLALLLLLLLMSAPRAARSDRFRRLSLLAKCLLLSMLVHLLILLCLTLWQVGVGVDRYLRSPAGGVIAVNLPSAGDDIAEQLRAGAGDAPLPVTAPVEAARFTAELPSQPELPPAPPELPAEPVTIEVAVLPAAATQDAPPPPPMRSGETPSLTHTPASEPVAAAAPSPPTPRTKAEATPELPTPDETALRSMERPDAVLLQPAQRSEVAPPPLAPASTPAPETLATTSSDAEPVGTPSRMTPVSDAIPPPAGSLTDVLAIPATPAAASAQEATASLQTPVILAARPDLAHENVRADAPSLVAPPTRAVLPAHTALIGAASPSDAAAPQRTTPPPMEAVLSAMESLITPSGPAPANPATSLKGSEQSEPALATAPALLPPLGRAQIPPTSDATTRLAAALPVPAAIDTAPSTSSPILGPAGPTDATITTAMSARGARPLESVELPSLTTVAMPALPNAAQASQQASTLPMQAVSAEPMQRPSLPKGANAQFERPAELPPASQAAAAPTPSAIPLGSAGNFPTAKEPAMSLADAARRPSPAEGLPDLEPTIALPIAPQGLTDAYSQRAPEVRAVLVDRLGGSDETERAVALALTWLARHQSPDGGWSSSGFDDGCGECGGTSRIKSDVALTGLSLLCFLGADHTHTKEGPYQSHVRKALDRLVAAQSESGDLRAGETMYSHGIAAIALSEAYGMTGDPNLREPVERATRFIVSARSVRSGGWRYDPGQPGDTSVLGWQVLAMASAKRTGITVPDSAFAAAGDWLRQVSWPQRPGVYSYQPGLPFTTSMTAEGLFVQQLLGKGRDDPATAGSVAYLSDHLPSWDHDASTYYWYYATLALFQYQGEAWETWNAALKRELLGNQRKTGPAAGSWDTKDKYSAVGGRVYQTAICTLCLEVYYRYLPMYGMNQQGGQLPADAAR